MKILKKLMTDNYHCSRRLCLVLTAVLLTSFWLQAPAQRMVWNLPQYMENIQTASFALGGTEARDTYLSASTYEGFVIGFENDRWTGYEPHRLFSLGRNHSDFCFSMMENRLGGGSTMGVMGRDYAGFMWHAVKNTKCDLLVGPAVMCQLGLLYNRQNSNNPVNVEGYLGAGVCVDNSFRFRFFRQDMALLATFYAPLAGMSFAPDYDQPYYYLYRYGEYGKALHFITPFNNLAFMQQVAFVLPVKENRLKVGVTMDGLRNSLGGHSRFIFNSMVTLGYAMRYQTKRWDK